LYKKETIPLALGPVSYWLARTEIRAEKEKKKRGRS
jgi:hypothetical protein